MICPEVFDTASEVLRTLRDAYKAQEVEFAVRDARLVKAKELLQKRVDLTWRQFKREQARMAEMRRDIEDDVVHNSELAAALVTSKAEGEAMLAELRHRMKQVSAYEADLAAHEAGLRLQEEDLALQEMDATTREATFEQRESQVAQGKNSLVVREHEALECAEKQFEKELEKAQQDYCHKLEVQEKRGKDRVHRIKEELASRIRDLENALVANSKNREIFAV